MIFEYLLNNYFLGLCEEYLLRLSYDCFVIWVCIVSKKFGCGVGFFICIYIVYFDIVFVYKCFVYCFFVDWIIVGGLFMKKFVCF